jgi:hypothetical protein
MELKYIIYFIIGGIIMSLVTYLANSSKELFAAFIATLPVITISTILMIYINTGEGAVIRYAKGLLIMMVPWVVFVATVIILAPRIRLFYSVLVGLLFQVLLALVIMRKFGSFYKL